MKLLELLPQIVAYQRIRRLAWNQYDGGIKFESCIVRSQFDAYPLIRISYPHSLQLEEWTPTIDDLLADDWEIVND